VVDVLIADWYPSAKPRIRICCSSCRIPHFDLPQCFRAMLLQEANRPPQLQCPTYRHSVEVQKIAPDIALADLVESSLLFSENELDFTFAEQDKETDKEKEKEKEKEEKRCKLGKGGFGVVYKARLLRNNGILVAVKEINELSEFHHEIWMMRFVFLPNSFLLICSFSCFWHPNVVRFYGVCLHPLCIVMEFMAGGSLESFLHDQIKQPAIGPFDAQWKLRIQLSLDIARGVNAMHNRTPPIIHRDINSRNVLVKANSLYVYLINQSIDFLFSLHQSGEPR